VPTDLEIARAAELRPIVDIAAKLGLEPRDIEPYGHHKAKIPLEIASRGGKKGRLVLVTGTSPTPAGEGKSTVSVGLADALALRERNPVLCLREPSLGPVFGIKGGAAGGGHSQVIPMEDIDLHFSGDFHAITSAHALLAAMLDNHIYRPNDLDIDVNRVVWRRAVDMNDRALRNIVLGLGGRTGGIPRQDGFVITAASEIMAIFCLSDGHEDLQRRLGEIIVAYDRNGAPVCAADLKAPGAMSVLLKDALRPNLVQTLAGTPAFIHGGPFANIAHGCNSVLATRTGLALGDVVVTEAGFGSDLGAEKFFDIKCRSAGLEPEAAVIVTTIRALKMHGGVGKDALADENVEAVRAGTANLGGHVDNVSQFGVPPVVAVNRFVSDTEAEVQVVLDACAEWGVRAVEADPWGGGGRGCLDLADAVWEILEEGEASFEPLYPDAMPLAEKIETVAEKVYGADGVDFGSGVKAELGRLEELGLGELPVCIAKTQYSFSDDASLLGRPEGFRIQVKDVWPSAGAGFVVAQTGNILIMPGLSARPAAEGMDIVDGDIVGLS
jgi:formate--tetrahydrofolate ligase